MIKYELLPQQLLLEGTATEQNFFQPEKMTDDKILFCHTQEYLNKLKTLSLTRKEERATGFPVRDELIERGRYIANGTLQCALFALEHGVALNIAGGTHHAYANRGEGFCLFNDFAIAAHILLNQKIVQKILIVDLDVHQGNGTAKIFENDPRVYTFSMHGERNYPLRKEQSDLDIGLEDGTKDEKYLEILKSTLTRLIPEVQPDIIFYLAGVDVLEVDKLGRLALTLEGCKQRDYEVFNQSFQKNIPISVSMGGGYAPRIADIIEAHANTYRVAFDFFA